MCINDYHNKTPEELREFCQHLKLTDSALKVLINSVYGATANKHFDLANPDLAAAITSSGRFFIRLLAKNIETRLQRLIKSPEPYVIYQDTDSVTGDTKIEANGEILKIEDMWNHPNTEEFTLVTNTGHQVRKIRGIQTSTYSLEKGYHKSDMVYIMRHKVRKKQYKIKVIDDLDNRETSVIVTEDHALKALGYDNDGRMVIGDVSPGLLSPRVRLILRNSNQGVHFTNNFVIEDLGEREEYVYDIEVKGTHSFFANDILVHNSCYYHIKPFVIKKFGESADPESSEVIDWIDEFEIKIIQTIINETIDQYADIVNAFDSSVIGVGREIIADSAVFVAKKKYFARVRDNEGVRYDPKHPYVKVMGLEIAKSSTPPWCKSRLQEAIPVILESDALGLRKWRDKVKLEFQDQPIMDISMTAGVSRMDYDLNDSGIPQGSRAAICHNLYLERNGLQQQIEPLKPGEKYKRCYLKTPNRFDTEILSFEDDRIAETIRQDNIFDYKKNFQKFFESPLENMTKSLGYDLSDKPTFAEMW